MPYYEIDKDFYVWDETKYIRIKKGSYYIDIENAPYPTLVESDKTLMDSTYLLRRFEKDFKEIKDPKKIEKLLAILGKDITTE